MSFINRSEVAAKLKIAKFDLLIIGGGITGAGIALDAVTRGLKVALIEKNDFAFGTSSRSTKLIHGGLRYLKQLEFGLVKEVGSERAVVHKLAPHLVIPEKMLLPLTDKSLGATLTSIGLKIYDWLAGVKIADRRKMLTRQQTLRHEPLLNKDGIKAGALYAEYRTDDARLTIEIIKTAARHGVKVLNYCRAAQFNYREGSIVSINAKDEINSDLFTIKCKCVVNATGPWVDELRKLDNSQKGKQLHLTKGVHIVVAHEKFPIKQAIYFDVEDGRMVFSIPRGKTTYIGTTDTDFEGEIDLVLASRKDVDYLLNAVNKKFGSINLNSADILSSWAGLRPLIHEEGKSGSELSRKDEIFESPTGLISIAGGKLTGYRKMAERVVDLVIEKNFPDFTLKDCFTDRIPLVSDDFKSYDEVSKYIIQIEAELLKLKLEPSYASYLVSLYGIQTNEIIKLFDEINEIDVEIRLTLAELDFALSHEMIVNSLDFFIRRTGMMYFDIKRVKKCKEKVIQTIGNKNEWADDRMSAEKELLDLSISQCTQFE